MELCFVSHRNASIKKLCYMRITNILWLTAVSCLLCCCKKDDTNSSYSVDEIVTANVQATLYFHIIFCEAENAWALVHNTGYSSKIFGDTVRSSYKVVSFVETAGSTYEVHVKYNNWWVRQLGLSGEMIVKLPNKNVYRTELQTANVTLNGFSIAQQRVVGSSSIKYIGKNQEENDTYDYTFKSAKIYDVTDAIAIISADITSGRYTRVEGGSTVVNSIKTPNVDSWTFNATMTGSYRENLSYTNKILSNVAGGILYFSKDCTKKAIQGISQLIVPGQPYIEYDYGLSCDASIRIITLTEGDK